MEYVPQRTCQANRREQTCHDTDDKRQSKVLDRSNTENIYHTDRKKGGNGRIDRTSERAYDTGIHLFGKGCAASHGLVIFANTVKDDDSRVDGITENGKERCNNVGVYRDVDKPRA